MNQEEIRLEAEKAGAEITTHRRTGTLQIDGHRWDRWAELRHKADPAPHVAYYDRTMRCASGKRISVGRSVVYAA